MAKPKRKNKQDATLINIRAAKKRIKALEQLAEILKYEFALLARRVTKLEKGKK